MAGIFDKVRDGVEDRRVSFVDGDRTVITFDCTISEDHVLSQKLTSHPLEDGSVINDHTVKPPNVLSLRVVKSSHPFSLENTIKNISAGLPGSILSQSGSEVGGILGAVSTAVGISAINDYKVGEEGKKFTPVQVAFNALEALRDGAVIFDVITELKSYKSMMIKDVKVRRDSKTRYALYADIVVEEVRIVKSQGAKISKRELTPPGNVKGGGAKKSDGTEIKDTEKLSNAEDKKTLGTKQGKRNSWAKTLVGG